MNEEEVPISKNLELTQEHLDSKYINEFLENKFIDLKTQTFIKCNKCGENNEFLQDITLCKNCGARLNSKKTNTITSITAVHYTQILKDIKKFLIEKLKMNISDIPEHNVIIIHHKNKEIYVIFPEISSSEFLIRKDSEHCILVYFDPRTRSGSMFQNREFYIGQFTNLDKDELVQILDALSENQISEFAKAESSLNTFLDELDALSAQEKGEKFEIFVKKMLDGLKTILPDKIEHLRITHPNDLYNSKTVKIGGAGNEDFHIMNLHDYLSCIKPEMSGDAKCYNKSKLTVEDFGKALFHANSGAVLIITTTDDIAPSIWENVITIQKQEGYYKYVIIDKELLLILLGFLIEKNTNFFLSN